MPKTWASGLSSLSGPWRITRFNPVHSFPRNSLEKHQAQCSVSPVWPWFCSKVTHQHPSHLLHGGGCHLGHCEKGIRQATVSVQVPDGCPPNRLFFPEVLHFSKLNSVWLGSGTLTVLTATLTPQLTLVIPTKIDCVCSAGTHSPKVLVSCKYRTCWRRYHNTGICRYKYHYQCLVKLQEQTSKMTLLNDSEFTETWKKLYTRVWLVQIWLDY